MPLTAGLTDDQVRHIAELILARDWAGVGVDGVDVRSGPDHDGDPALFVTVALKPGSQLLPPDIYDRGRGAVDDALRAEGETRFAYFRLDRPDEPIVDDDILDGP